MPDSVSDSGCWGLEWNRRALVGSKEAMATHQLLEKLERDLDAQGVTDPDYREVARVMMGKALVEAEQSPEASN